MAERQGQQALLNLTSTFLMAEPSFKKDDQTANHLKNLVCVHVARCRDRRMYGNSRGGRLVCCAGQFMRVAQQGDPEFCLKLALYLRDDLNIRSTANFLVVRVSFASVACRSPVLAPRI